MMALDQSGRSSSAPRRGGFVRQTNTPRENPGVFVDHTASLSLTLEYGDVKKIGTIGGQFLDYTQVGH